MPDRRSKPRCPRLAGIRPLRRSSLRRHDDLWIWGRRRHWRLQIDTQGIRTAVAMAWKHHGLWKRRQGVAKGGQRANCPPRGALRQHHWPVRQHHRSVGRGQAVKAESYALLLLWRT
eukprot:scaffold1175_cov248-Pinguiococcus_pyrenoidosus.AAC.6